MVQGEALLAAGQAVGLVLEAGGVSLAPLSLLAAGCTDLMRAALTEGTRCAQRAEGARGGGRGVVRALRGGGAGACWGVREAMAVLVRV